MLFMFLVIGIGILFSQLQNQYLKSKVNKIERDYLKKSWLKDSIGEDNFEALY